MKPHDIPLLRLSAQHISKADFNKPEDVAKHLLAMQAQDYNGGLWSIGLRTAGAKQKEVERAIRDRKLVRSWPMRGTLHLMHADDVHWLTDLLAPRATAAAKGRRIAQLSLSDDIMADIERQLRRLLSHEPLRRDALKVALQASVKSIDIDNIRFGHLLRHYGEAGLLCFGPHDGKQPTFVLLDAWIPRPAPNPRDQALAELASRYFAGHGPATLKDFAGWGMLTIADAKLGIAGARDLITEVIGDTTYYLPHGLKPAQSSHVQLLPGFDEYILGYKDRSAQLAPEHGQLVIPGNNGMFKATVVADGKVVGLWKRPARKAFSIDTEFFNTPVTIPDAVLRRYADFLGATVSK